MVKVGDIIHVEQRVGRVSMNPTYELIEYEVVNTDNELEVLMCKKYDGEYLMISYEDISKVNGKYYYR